MANYLLYLDPGSGSFIVQAIAAAALGIAFFFRNIRNSIRAFFTRSKKSTDNQPD
jgi:superfamily I DNA and RNA helicase